MYISPSKQPRLRKFAVGLALTATVIAPLSASAATTKIRAGAACEKSGRTSKVGGSVLRCTKVKGTLKWVVAKATTDTTTPKSADTKAPDTKAPDTKAPATKAPDTKAPAAKAPATKAPDTKAP